MTLRGTSRSFRAFSAVMKTFSAKASEVPRKWWVIDAKNQVLGQVAVRAANLLRGKEKTIFTPHVDTGDFVVVGVDGLDDVGGVVGIQCGPRFVALARKA